MTLEPVDYRWALDATGYPVPVDLAQRGVAYSCPLCHGTMIPRLGAQVQHHYAHERQTGCTPEAVSRALIARWITLKLSEARAANRPARVSWTCAYCANRHTDDLLARLLHIKEGAAQHHEGEEIPIDVALYGTLDPERREDAEALLGAILVQDNERPSPRQLRALDAPHRFVITVPLSFAPKGPQFGDWISEVTIHSGPCPFWQQNLHIVRRPEAVRAVLLEMMARQPDHFVASVETISGLANMAKMEDWLVWLPPERWRDIVCGTLNTLDRGVSIVIQTWNAKDGRTAALYYVTIQGTHAVGFKWYAPGETPAPRVEGTYSRPGTTALDLVRDLVSG